MYAQVLALNLISPKDVIDAAKSAIDWIFELLYGGKPPQSIQHRLGIALAFLLFLVFLWGALWAFSKIKKLWLEDVWPLFSNADQKRAAELRRRFADHLHNEIRRLNNLEQWSDHRFAELEAEVEAEGSFRSFLRPFSFFAFLDRDSVRREKSLSRALQTSKERLILVEGEPGAGKSVALRHLAQDLSFHASNSKRNDSILPIYINLKELDRTNNEPIGRELIKNFILKSLNRVNSRDVEHFLDDTFEEGLRTGTWLFLFDSFDELPEILSSVEADSVIATYADAIAGFLGGMGSCRGIIASREFRGPNKLGWPRFRILALTNERQHKLIRKAALKKNIREQLIGNLSDANEALKTMASNPMFLGLLTEYVQSGAPFPSNSHVVFDDYIQERLLKDKDKLAKRFNLMPNDVRFAAEQIAFCISVDPTIGLSPSRESLNLAIARNKIKIGIDLSLALDALEYIKLGRSELRPERYAKSFTFSHRRFQEYFATCVVLREPGLVPPDSLLTDGRWREAAVVLFQTQEIEVTLPLLQHLADLIPLSLAQDGHTNGFKWPVQTLHLIGLLQDGFMGRVSQIPGAIRSKIGILLSAAVKSPLLLDKKWALDVAAPLPTNDFQSIVREAIDQKSRWLDDAAYRQASRLTSIPDDIALWIRKSLAHLALNGKLARDRISITTYVLRLPSPTRFIQSFRLLIWLPTIDVGCCALALLEISLRGRFTSGHMTFSFVIGLLVLVLAPYLLYQLFFSFEIVLSQFVFIRFVILSLIGIRIAGNPLPFNRPVLLVPFIYCCTWMPSALKSAINGDFAAPIWWAIQPVTPIFRLIPEIFKKRSWDWKEIRKLLFLFSLMGAWVGLVFYTLVKLGKLLPHLASYIAFLMMAIAFSGLAIVLCELCQDTIKWHRRSKTNNEEMTLPNLFDCLIRYRSAFYRSKMFKEFRKYNYKFESEFENNLRIFAVALERSSQQNDLEVTFNSMLKLGMLRSIVKLSKYQKPIIDYPLWLRDWNQRQRIRGFLNWGPRCKDELNRFIEFLSLQRPQLEQESVKKAAMK